MSLDEKAILEQFKSGYSFPPLEIRLGQAATRKLSQADAILYISNGEESFEFIAEFKARGTPRVVEDAARRIKAIAESSSRWPILVVPYLREERLEDLRRYKVSGIDLCGNGLVSIPGKLYVYRTGKPNKFPESQPLKYAYRGKTSLVARTFLLKSVFQQLEEVQKEMDSRNCKISLPTISKALKRMEEDIIIERQNDEIRLIQSDKLLENLSNSYVAPKIRRKATCRSSKSLANLFASLSPQQKIAFSGRSSINAYATMGRDEYPVIYTNNISALMKKWGSSVEETSRFVDFELQETNDPTVYFDTRIKEGIPYASPLQVYIECTSGDKREQETAVQVREVILNEQS